MPVDFRRFRADRDKPPLHPRDVFSSLSRREQGFGYLRDVQGQVLDAWFARRAERDVAIKMNTGTGKTAVGLLALRSSLNERIGPALYVAPDNFLAGQVAAQARSLGIRYTDDPDTADYISGDSIGIINIHKLVNGRSIFGGPGSGRVQPLAIGMVVIDDAHACLKTVEDQTTVRLPEVHPAYAQILRLFEADLRRQSISAFTDLENRALGVIMRVPISAWADRHTEVARLLQQYYSGEDDSTLRFTWPFVKEILPACQAIFSSDAFEIQALCPPTNSIVSLEDAHRRLYLTATLADDSVLITHFGVSDTAAKNPVTPSSAADIGDRLILSPRELDANISDERIREIVGSLSREYNVVVLVPSYRRANLWNDRTDLIVGAEEIETVVESLKIKHVGLVVLVNKYDGVDLPNDACRILVIDGVPEAITNSERREAEVLGGSDVLAHRKLQRIEQGMGRGVRSAEDFCVVLLLSAGLSSALAKPQIRDRLGPATRAQLDLSTDVAQEIGIEDLEAVIEQCLKRDSSWLEVSRECLAGIAYSTGSIEPFAVSIRRAFVAASVGQFDVACDEMRVACNVVDDKKTKGWLQERLATYLHNVDPVQAQEALVGAVRLNSRVLRPLSGVRYRRASSTIDQARTACRALKQQFDNRTELRLQFEDLMSRLVFDPNGSKDFENAIEEVGGYLGFQSQRPERDIGNGPDALWGLGAGRFLVIECKSEATSVVWKKDSSQLAHSMNWFETMYEGSCSPIPLLVHHSGELADDAVLPREARLLDENHLAKLRATLIQYAAGLSNETGQYDESSIHSMLNHFGFGSSEFVQRYTKAAV